MSFTLDDQSVSDLIEFVDHNVRASGCDHSLRFSAAWARQRHVNWDDLLDALVLSRIAKLPDGTPVATDIRKRVGIASKHEELNIHRVILRR